MAVTPKAVYNTHFKISTDIVYGVTNLKVNDKFTLVDITSQGDAYTRRFPTIEDWSINADVVVDVVNDTAQAAIHTAWRGKSTVTVVVDMDESHTHYYSGTGYVESFDKTFDPSGVIKGTVVIQATSALSYT